MVTNSNIPITFFSDDTYSVAKTLHKIYPVLAYFCYFVLIVGAFCNKIVGLELFAVLQTSFFSLSNTDRVHPFLTPLFQLQMLNGYNIPITDIDRRHVPDRVSAIGYSADFSTNFNISLGILCFLPILSLLFSASQFVFRRHAAKLSEVAGRVRGEYLLTVTLFFSLSYGYSFGLQLLYGKFDFLNFGMLSLAFVVVSAVLLMSRFCPPSYYGEFVSSLRFPTDSRLYFCLALVYKLTMGAIMSTFNSSPLVSFGTLSLSLCFLVYQLSVRPFGQAYHNYRSVFLQIGVCVMLFLRMLHRLFSDKKYYTLENNSDYSVMGLVEAAFIVCSVVVSLMSLLYEAYSNLLKRSLKMKKNNYFFFSEHRNFNSYNKFQQKTQISETMDD